jgi:CBS domain-containing protein
MTSPSTKKQLTVEGVMHSGLVTCKPEATLRAVAEILATHRIHAVVVASRDEKAPCAVVSDRDVVYAHSEGMLDRLTAREAASEPTITVRADLDLRHASGLMARYGTTHIVVTAPGDGEAVGILSSLDVAKAIAAT